ncbi:protein disulfide isomerase-like protein 1-5 [Cinnamomum micranthum f. kanehirae]|uniref:protein disulfide-isomerase n=1 Tax=Cinnamomum micranthum f. kanehirae TaxID=337451 RepID=A0A3S4N6M7_9MAGN|nr:protein disulfide isomerase-like protein 1-5 [Cinnamomum micranthum f. kanehirae]
MFSARPTSRFTISTLILLLFISFSLSAIASVPHRDDPDEDVDLEGLEELLAIDDSEEDENQKGQAGQEKLSGPEVLRRAQRVVLELSNENAKRIIDGNEYVLLLGYAPWCHRSAEMMPQFAEAAMALKEMGSPLLLAKLDAERHAKAASLLGIKGFPTLLLFVNGSSHPYTGGFTGEEIVIWARKRTGVPIIRLSSVTVAEEFLKKHQMFAVGLFENFEGHDYEEFVKAATADNEIQFVETNNIDVAVVLFPDARPKNNFLGLVKSGPERYETFEDSFEEGKILQFLDYNKFPLVTVLTEFNSIRVHSSPIKVQVYIFAEAVDFNKLLPLLQNVARKFKSKILFVYADTADDNLAKPFLTLFGLESEEPIVAAFDNENGSKYLLESDLTANSLEEFCHGLLHGTLSPYYKSEPIPDTKGIVHAVVGKTFDTLVLNSDKNVLLEVYTPWCINCEAVSKQIEQLAKHFEGLDSIIFARIDASLNEHPKLQINDYPSLLFYPSGDKLNPIKLSKKPSLKELVMFINANVKIEEDRGISTPDQTTKDEL